MAFLGTWHSSTIPKIYVTEKKVKNIQGFIYMQVRKTLNFP